MQKNHVFEEDIKFISDTLKEEAHLLEGKSFIITGGAGFLGHYILGTVAYLNKNILKKPCKVLSLDNFITSSELSIEKLHGKLYIQNKRHDVTKHLQIGRKVDYIIHAAGIASPIYYQKYPLETIDVAVTGTKKMLELARRKKVKSFLFFSSSEIYGNPPSDEIPTKETYNGNVSPVGPRSCYDESKRLGETLCLNYYHYFGIPTKIVRPFNVYGPGMRTNDYRVIPSFINSALLGKSIPVHESGKQTRTFCYISDAIIATFKVLLSGRNGEAYNIGNNQPEIDMNHLAQVLNKTLDNRLKIRNISYPTNYPQGEPQRRCPDLTKIRREVGYKPRITLEEGLRRTLEWCRTNWKLLNI